MQFSYRGKDNRGVVQQGSLTAANPDAAASELMRRGITPLTIREQEDTSSALDKLNQLPLFRKAVTLDELIVFCRQMHALTKAGIPLIRTMRGLAETTRSPVLAEVLEDITNRLEGGTTMATAMQAHPKVFSELFIAMIHVGENTGMLDDSFKRLSEILELERDTKRRVKQALRYPTFVVIALLAALMVVNFLVIPRFASVFAKLGADLPFLTQVLVGTSNFLLGYWPLMLFAVAAGAVLIRQWKRTEQGRLMWDRYKLKLPIIGPLLELITLSRFARNFATMLKAGMPVTHALTVVADATDNAWIGSHIKDMRLGIERGESLLRTARHSEMFTPLILQMIAVGEETGSVDDMLNNVADFYDEDVDYGLKRLAESIEPILIVAMGVLVLILALGVFLPIWDLGAAAMGRG
ncbi:MSHA biogenesis protein MshG [Marinobacter sp. EVN1]|jgi:MSHA biogenesis protein MshG|uniref:MSHA biogenesis protein MshG n=2 Tax=Marinobacter nauticus TaxID=2743 RepID=A0A368UWU3_MARNT|nr:MULTISPECIES: type II secretion system F family protein [Marinobacter]ERS88645.1 MSHA biogenesis protein MshG [Marinobacter sp. EVN1]MBW3198730.1 type II secretion system F family protein [Marinobacter nauticus]MBY6184140.1 type II secretion system F family protein [Marinobacter nauticus]MBY6195415.1 type II secretion system F family protein [Marinobacter nauticus]MBY6216563.1 type II secretion system F family protein [Marinobacter nauticus]